MRFRRMCDEMSSNEIEMILRIIFPEATLIGYEKEIKANSILVKYILPYQSEVNKIEFLPDAVYGFQKNDNEYLISGDKAFQYQNFTIARGYSEHWLNNGYIHE